MSRLLKIGKKPEDYMAKCYKIDEFLKAYGGSIEPITGEDNWVKSGEKPMKPPMFNAMPERSKIKRKKAAHEEPKVTKKDYRAVEKMPKDGISMTCSNCQQTGHNMRKCKNPSVNPIAATNVSLHYICSTHLVCIFFPCKCSVVCLYYNCLFYLFGNR